MDAAADPPAAPRGGRLHPRRWTRSWRRTSYTAPHGAATTPAPGIASETEETDHDRRTRSVRRPAAPAAAVGPGTPSLMNALAGGTAFGTLVHAVLEAHRHRRGGSGRRSPAPAAGEVVASPARRTLTSRSLPTALTAVMTTPLPAGHAGRRRRPPTGWLELDFELPLAGGDAPTGPRGDAVPRSPTCSAATYRRTTRSPATPLR